jgi:group I intron endonuclease
MTVSLYTAQHLSTGRVYVGISKDPEKRKGEHRRDQLYGRGSHFSHALAKYGEHEFTWQVVHSFATRELASSAEIHTIAFLKASGIDLFNQTGGGDGGCGWIPTAEVRARMGAPKGTKHSSAVRQRSSERQKGKPHSAEHTANAAAARVGVKLSDATRLKMSVAHTGKKKGPMSEDTKKKISAAKTGRTLSDETRAKMSAAAKRRWS